MRRFWVYISLAGLQFIIDRISFVFSQMYTTSQMGEDTHYLVTLIMLNEVLRKRTQKVRCSLKVNLGTLYPLQDANLLD